MALRYYKDKNGHHHLEFEHNLVLYHLKDERWFPPIQFVRAWVSEIMTKEVMEEYEELQQKYYTAAWEEEHGLD